MVDTRDKNLLVITHAYTSYVKNQVESIASNFKHVYVLVRLNPAAEIANYIPINYLQPFTKKAKINTLNKPENVSVIPTSVFYFPTKAGREKRFDAHFRSVDEAITKYQIKFDLIHAHFTSSAGYAGAKIKEKYGKPLIITVHENRDWLLTEHESKNEKIEFAWKTADILCRVNKLDIPLLEKYNQNVTCIANGFDENHFKPMDKYSCRKKLGIPADSKVIFSLGLLIERKGYSDLIDAIINIQSKNGKVLCYIGGHGKIKNKLQNKINNNNLQQSIKLLGFVDDKLIPIWINASDIFVLPSHSEGNPTVMFESLGCGTPYVGTNVGGVPEIIVSEDYGLLSDPKDVTSLTNNINISLNKTWDNNIISKYAINYTWKNIGINYMRAYETILCN